jgi:hypothetical protein
LGAREPERTGRARQGMLVRVMPDLLQVDAGLSASGRALPAELLPYAAVQLLPALLLCGLAAAEITGPGGNSQAPDFIASVLVRALRLLSGPARQLMAGRA